MENYYILMADIVKSREKDGVAIMDDFKEVVSKIKDDHREHFLSPPTITLGDEFQSIVASSIAGIEVIFALEEMLLKLEKEFKLRYVLYYGRIDTVINAQIAYGMMGEGLAEARGLLGKQKVKKIRFYFKMMDETLSNKLGLAFTLYQSIIDDWKMRDFSILRQFFIDDDYKKVADHLNKDASLIWRRKKSLRLNEYRAIKQLILLLLKETPCPK
jgi:hypothetical protein